VFLVGPVHAASLCGTVRDAQTQDPVAGAALFLFDESGTYTGLYEDSGADGGYCFDPVPPGVYTLQVRRDDYLVAVVEQIEVLNAVDVEIQASTTVLFAAPFPSPASDQLNLRFRAPAGAPLLLEVYDVAGRRVRAWRGRGTGTDHQLGWDLIDHRGRPLASGIYHARLRAVGTDVTRRFVLLR
jgi:hypothetical protein